MNTRTRTQFVSFLGLVGLLLLGLTACGSSDSSQTPMERGVPQALGLGPDLFPAKALHTAGGLLLAGTLPVGELKPLKAHYVWDGFLGAVAPEGGWQWFHQVTTPNLPAEKEHHHEAEALISTGDGGALALFSDWDYDEGGYLSSLLVKVDGQGAQLWTRDFAGPHSKAGSVLLEAASGNLLVAGTSARSTWLTLLDPGGELIWERTFPAPDDELVGSLGVSESPDGGFLAVSMLFLANRLFVLRVDAQGDLVTSKVQMPTAFTFGEDFRAIPGGGLVMVGRRSAGTWKTGLEIVTFNSEGAVVANREWVFGGQHNAEPWDLLLTTAGELLVIGSKIHYTMEPYDGSMSAFEDTEEPFLAALDLAGRGLWAVSWEDHFVSTLTETPEGEVLVIGKSDGEVEVTTFAYESDQP